MLLKNALLLAVAFFSLVLCSCDKPVLYDDEARSAQLAKDIDSIAKFVAAKDLTVVKEPNGLSYQVLRRGSGVLIIEDTDTILINYRGRLIANDSLVEAADSTFLVVGDMPAGIKYGLKVKPPGLPNGLQRGGEIRLLIPSTLAYTNKIVFTTLNPTLGIYTGKIPANSSLDYSFQILNINKYTKKE
jgi:FKBP-type peptidyl-prolyl cis-trans isomerase